VQSPLGSALGKQFGLGGFGSQAGLFGIGTFTREPFTVQSHLLEQIKGLHGKVELVLRNRQAASISFHGRFKQGLCRRGSNCGISGAGLGCWKLQSCRTGAAMPAVFGSNGNRIPTMLR
jgi:hypothetical protein